MNLEEIEARWKDATPGPWTFDVRSGGIASDNVDVIYEGHISIADGTAIAAAPADIAYLLDRVRKLERMLDWSAKCADKDVDLFLKELAKYKRAHAWFVENTADFGCACDDKDDCEWVKAKELLV